LDERSTIRVNLTQKEIKEAKIRLGREPNETELGMIDVMWSEHCSYKSSRKVLQKLPKQGKRVVVGPGYDSGVVDINDGDIVAFKVESHNHPSAIEPYNGAATGIGGIIRDILCMNCRPVGLLDSLRFGNLQSSHSKWLLQNVVKGIADYGNCTGIPTIAGEVEFDESFETNCLVNVGCLGFGKLKELKLGRMDNPGDIIILVGGSTGRDGIHGVTFASRVIGEESELDRPAVQIGDPFVKKLAIEATLEALRTGQVTAVKDLGGGGLTCALSEMSSKGNSGVEIDLNVIHVRESEMTPYELLLSESQERMLFTVLPEGHKKVLEIFERWGLSYSIIGKVTNNGNLIAKYNDKIIVNIPAKLLTNSPLAVRLAKKPKTKNKKYTSRPKTPINISKTILRLLKTVNIASKENIYRQYDHEVGIRTILKPGDADAAVLRLIGKNKAVAIKVDCNSAHCFLDPYNGHASAVAEAARNVVATGAEPIAITDCCNFGNPENPNVYWQFKQAINGMSYMLRGLKIPCVGGNVSFYNEDETTGNAIKPSTTIVMLGLIEDLKLITSITLKEMGQSIIMIGKTYSELGGSQYYRLLDFSKGKPPSSIISRENASIKTIMKAIRNGYITAAHDCSQGGISITLAEMVMKGNLGLKIDAKLIPRTPKAKVDDLLFSESNARFIVTTPKIHATKVLRLASKQKAPAAIIGEVSSDNYEITWGKKRIAWHSINQMKEAWEKAIPETMVSH
jgi:phosphoribosylformylglycinamidine synthase II